MCVCFGFAPRCSVYMPAGETMMKDALRKGRTCVPALVGAWCVACAACAPSRIQLQIEPEQPTTLLVGQVAAGQLSERQELAGSAGAALVLIERSNARG